MKFHYILLLMYLECSLISPYGTVVELFNYNTIGVGAMYQTVFDDESDIQIVDGSVPYYGNYQPTGSLSVFDGEEMQGTWTLFLYNNENGNGPDNNNGNNGIIYDNGSNSNNSSSSSK